MMDHKTMLNRTAKANVQLKIAEITDERKAQLIAEYYDPDNCLKSTTSQKVLIGNWLNNATRMLLKGATEEEINRVVEHIVVILYAVKRQLNVQKSYVDHNLLDLTKKYFGVYKQVKLEDGEIVYEKVVDDPLWKRKQRKEEHERKNQHRKEMQMKIQNMLDSGCTYEYIADELMIPESTVRNIMKFHD